LGNPKKEDKAMGVSCTSMTSCTAVGVLVPKPGSTPSLTFATRWTGTSWIVEATPNPLGARQNSLSGVSCPTARACVAVGSSENGKDTRLLVERWNGTSWSIQPALSPKHAKGTALTGVSCFSPIVCTAVGSYHDATGAQRTLAERWNGTSWAVQPTPNVKGSNSLAGVSCPGLRTCTAVGTGRGLTLAERWTGKSWAIQPTPNRTGTSELLGVSCPSLELCTAVGGYGQPPFGLTPLIERWIAPPR
jgi:hypothetical protein